MPKPMHTDATLSNGGPPSHNGQAASHPIRRAELFKRRIECCNGEGEEPDVATRAGDGYQRGEQ